MRTVRIFDGQRHKDKSRLFVDRILSVICETCEYILSDRRQLHIGQSRFRQKFALCSRFFPAVSRRKTRVSPHSSRDFKPLSVITLLSIFFAVTKRLSNRIPSSLCDFQGLSFPFRPVSVNISPVSISTTPIFSVIMGINKALLLCDIFSTNLSYHRWRFFYAFMQKTPIKYWKY